LQIIDLSDLKGIIDPPAKRVIPEKKPPSYKIVNEQNEKPIHQLK
jgi:hypothetical protein